MEKIKFWGSQEPEQKHDDDQDLTTLLTREERGELTVLIASATESMLHVLEDTFDASQIESEPTTTLDVDKDQNPNVDPSKMSPEEEEAARRAHEKREKELSQPKLTEIKEASIRFFDDWRNSVIARVGEVVNAREPEGDHTAGSKAPQESSDMKEPQRDEQDENIDAALQKLYPPVQTSLAKLPKAKRVLILHSTLLLLLSLEHYTAHSRVLLLYIASSLHLPVKLLAEDETKVAQGLLEAAKHMSGDDETQKRQDDNKFARRWKVGLASVAGAALIGVTGGLAAPLLAAGVGSVMGGLGLGATAAAGYLGTLAGSGVLVGSLFGAYGGRMTGKMMDAYAKEVQDFAFLPVHSSKKNWANAHESSPEDRRLRVAIGISGWLTDKEEVLTPWRVVGHNVEMFALRYELEALMNLGNALTSMVKSVAWDLAKSEIVKRTVFASLTAAFWPIGMLKIGRVVDNPFSVAKSRSEKAGEVLADALINRAQGERPVTLIGYSLGARVIYSCLMSLAQRKAFGLIESVVLAGAPVPSTASDWRLIRSVVSGRVINVYSENDYILGFLYRTSSIQYGVAGLQKVGGVKGVENVDASTSINGHLRYRYLVGVILEQVGFEDVVTSEVKKEEDALEAMEQDVQKEKRPATGGESENADDEAKTLEKEVERKNQESLMNKQAEKLSLEDQPGS
ncbi:MAG: hypothetical protein M1833_006707 [Piccolia ochrophora]|nr:MAG: hypothetical protein M1833_006707 [Piccolia ochrophora]